MYGRRKRLNFTVTVMIHVPVNSHCSAQLGIRSLGHTVSYQISFKNKNVNCACVNTGKKLLVGLTDVGNTCMWVDDGSTHGCGCMVYGSMLSVSLMK